MRIKLQLTLYPTQVPLYSFENRADPAQELPDQGLLLFTYRNMIRPDFFY